MVVFQQFVPEHPLVPHVHTGVARRRAGQMRADVRDERPGEDHRDGRVTEQCVEMAPPAVPINHECGGKTDPPGEGSVIERSGRVKTFSNPTPNSQIPNSQLANAQVEGGYWPCCRAFPVGIWLGVGSWKLGVGRATES